MKERPVPMIGEMVRATLDGRKTQTRRVVKPQPVSVWGQGVGVAGRSDPRTGRSPQVGRYFVHCSTTVDHSAFVPCPYGVPGDRLWVREKWRPILNMGPGPIGRVSYKSDNGSKSIWGDGVDFPAEWAKRKGWRPSIHMPRWASRITLEVADVRVERVQEISEEDARAEGVRPTTVKELTALGAGTRPSWRKSFEGLWDSINAARGFGWDANPWVWVVDFKRVAP